MKSRIGLLCCATLFFISYGYADNLSIDYCLPQQPCWPSSQAWDALNNEVHGHLLKGTSPLASCDHPTNDAQCQQVLQNLKNPFYIESQSGGTQSTGWYNNWSAQISPYVVAVESAEEIAAAVKFAQKHHIKLVVKGTGHDYLGRSNAANSLLIWTHNMREVQLIDNFTPKGCPSSQKVSHALSALAGNRWIEAYGKAIVEKGLYVQGGGCTSVGVAGGFIQGGGFGSFSKKFGTGAAGLLEAEVVTAEGKVLTVNQCQNQDLFWALKGGGGGTFGVVSRVILATHDLPPIFGAVEGTIKAKSDKAYKELIAYFILFYRVKLHNEHWGEQVIFTPNNELQLALVFQGMDKVEVDRLWLPFKNWLNQRSDKYQYTLHSIALPAQKFWDFNYLSKNLSNYIVANPQKNAPAGEFWWIGNQSEVSIYLTYYQSMYLPYRLFLEANAPKLAKALFDASRLTRLSLHFNKGLSGASQDAITRQKNTAMTPDVLDAAALITISGGQQYAYPNLSSQEPNYAKAKQEAINADKAIHIFRALSPQTGTYGNEADYQLPHWQHALWGDNYKKLLQIKHKYDPTNVFSCHHCVGSEEKSMRK